MNGRTHTPGPWWLRYCASGYTIEQDANRHGDHRRRIVRASGGIERREDAALIAAAPDLLAACRAMLEAPAEDSDARLDAYEQMARAVSRAEDRQWTVSSGNLFLMGPRTVDVSGFTLPEPDGEK
jgi:hypothetical protein